MMNVSANPWETLRRFTDARIALGRAGCSMPTAPLLAFNLAHAQARDAVHRPLDVSALRDELTSKGFESATVCSGASSRDVYLRRPDLGRCLSETSATQLESRTKDADLVFVIADGLSSNAASTHAIALIEKTIARLDGWRIGPVVIATQARVALGDCIGSILKARIVAVLIGERPGLSSPASLGVYVTYDPRQSRSDAERNCISNVRPEGLAYDAAAFKLAWLLNEARSRKLTGVGLKDDSATALPGRTTDRLARG
ncbi:ethanolamine ammonia-lyase [Caballeronia megalochromosomata]|jgi:ethanolamine ammonia-lyase small subunit|nr:ethanolamine ammonia-lyase [Caballeronia megalochromosomata]